MNDIRCVWKGEKEHSEVLAGFRLPRYCANAPLEQFFASMEWFVYASRARSRNLLITAILAKAMCFNSVFKSVS